MSVEENKLLSRQTFEGVWNQGNLAAIDELDDANQGYLPDSRVKVK